jgi:RNA polymerase sigma-70 factor (ECF subfamily)
MAVTLESCKDLSDNEIVAKSLENLDYFSCLYQRFEPELLRYIHRVSGVDPDEAQDILQESFIKIWRNLNDFDAGMKFSSWAYRIVHNETVSHIRKKRSYGKDRTIDAELCRNMLSDEPETASYSEEDVAKALEFLEHLQDKYKEVLVLKFLEMKSYEEISDILKIPLGTVAIRINRAKKAFRDLAGNNLTN